MNRTPSLFRRFQINAHAAAVNASSGSSAATLTSGRSIAPPAVVGVASSLSYFRTPDAHGYPAGQRRHASSGTKNVTAAAADRRLAGRRRFYKHVSIAACSPPSRDGKNGDDSSSAAVDSPISAGVDGTQSASGVHHLNAADKNGKNDAWSFLLQPGGADSSSSWHTVTLDGRPLRTPLGLPLTLPSASLALAIATEWDAQHPHLRPAQMPLMTLCCTAIDQVASNPVPQRTDVLRYLRNDTTCYWADPTEDRVLYKRQEKAWDGLHASLTTDVFSLPGEVGPVQAVGGGDAIVMSRKSAGNPNAGLPHPPVLMDKVEKWVNSLDAWTLTALYSATAEAKSFLVGAALISEALSAANGSTTSGEDAHKPAAGRDAKWAKRAARVEEEFNIEAWGLVEGGHDYDRLNCSIQMHAASFLVQSVANSALEASASAGYTGGDGEDEKRTG